MLKKENIDHILRAAAAVSNQSRLVMVGTGAVIVTAKRIPASMMMTNEIDLYVEGNEEASDHIDAALGEGSLFHRSFRYYADGVGPNTAVMPFDWKARAVVYRVPNMDIEALCPSPNDIGIAKMCAFREKDVEWLREALRAGIANADKMKTLIRRGLPAQAPSQDEMTRRWTILLPPPKPAGDQEPKP